ncbi:MAG: hypothetical protein U0350_06100 [Caldilineaceae bacterium]
MKVKFLIYFLVGLSIWLLAACIQPEPRSNNGAPTRTINLCNPSDGVQCYPSPDQQWAAEMNPTKGSLSLNAAGKATTLFPPGSTVNHVTWAPDGQHLLVVLTNAYVDPKSQTFRNTKPVQIWQIDLAAQTIGQPHLVFTSPGLYSPEDIIFGQWSPNGRYLLFGIDPSMSASALSDGAPLRLLDVKTGKTQLLMGDGSIEKSRGLLNPRYQSWSPDSARLAITLGGYRSAQVRKWLGIFDPGSGQMNVVISDSEQIPGIVAWSPRGDQIAYAAVLASQTGEEWADLMTFANPAIAGRRIDLLNPNTGQHHRLNAIDAFQDAPVWSNDGRTLYYVQRDGDVTRLLAADPATGEGKVVEGSQRPAPTGVGYYGQSQWDDLLAYRPDAPRAALPALTQIYTDTAHGFTLRYPTGWAVADGWQALGQWSAMSTLQPTAQLPTELDIFHDVLLPFSGQAVIGIEMTQSQQANLDAVVAQLLTSPGPGQYIEPEQQLIPYHQKKYTLATRPALRLDTVDSFGLVNHLLLVLDGQQALILRGVGDGRLFDAIVETLHLP